MSFKEWAIYIEDKKKVTTKESIVTALKWLGWGILMGVPFGYIWAYNALMS